MKKDKDDKIIDGNPDKIKQVIDTWKFTRNILKKVLIGICLKLSVSDKKKNISQKDIDAWKNYIKNPTGIIDKDKPRNSFKKIILDLSMIYTVLL